MKPGSLVVSLSIHNPNKKQTTHSSGVIEESVTKG
jgi:hypothetical protein